MDYFARPWQKLDDHLRGTARLAEGFAAEFGAKDWGYLAGLWHDIGKFSSEFQQRLIDTSGDNAHIEHAVRVDHSTAGAQHASRFIKNRGFGRILAYVIAGHHGGLPDGNSPESCLRSRLIKDIPDYNQCPPEIVSEQRELHLPFEPKPQRAGMQMSTFVRMLYSSLVDADFLDTECYLDRTKLSVRGGYPSLGELEAVFFQNLNALRAESPKTLVNEQRERVLTQCLQAAEQNKGLFSLTVPTGGGKTLSSMAFGLRHALNHGLRRVIYVIPFTSIIEQNSAVFRSMLGQEVVLEHHSSFEPEEEDYRSRLACENWDAPIVVTTGVQFFESLFANRSSRCRRLHNVGSSVVILDEVQTLPPPYLLPCLEILKELVDTYGVSIVLCSATQPAVQQRQEFARGLEGVVEIIGDPQGLARILKRTEIQAIGNISNSELASQLKKHRQVLCIVNTRRHASTLFKALQPLEGLFHLSALMCPAHRSNKLAEIRERLKSGMPCRVVSTQLVEAGVDIDFPVVYRATAGIDSIAQAAGRCNREGKMAKGDVFVFTPEDGLPLGPLRQMAQTGESVMRRHRQDILSLEAIEEYFQDYYWLKGDRLDEKGILASLEAGVKDCDFPFRTIAANFHLIEDNSMPLIIPFDDEARSLIHKLDYVEYPTAIARRLQKFTISVYQQDWKRIQWGVAIRAGLFPTLAHNALYDEDLGLLIDDSSFKSPEAFIA